MRALCQNTDIDQKSRKCLDYAVIKTPEALHTDKVCVPLWLKQTSTCKSIRKSVERIYTDFHWSHYYLLFFFFDEKGGKFFELKTLWYTKVKIHEKAMSRMIMEHVLYGVCLIASPFGNWNFPTDMSKTRTDHMEASKLHFQDASVKLVTLSEAELRALMLN